MNPEKSFRILERIWGKRSGYVFLPWIDGDASTDKQRRRSYHEGRAFYWPKEKSAILKHMAAHTDDDLYFCPNLFDGKRRNYQLAREERALWADLDKVDPREVDPDLQPTIAWESSPGSYQAIWLLTADALLASEAGGLGQRLTYFLGADLGGWDATQLLRPPGWRNHKLEYKEEYGREGAPGKLLWSSGPKYDPAELESMLPEVRLTSAESEDVIEQDLDAVDRHKVLDDLSMKLPRKVKDLLKARETSGDRSETLFYLEQSLAEAGCTLSEIIAIVRPTVWNKYADRQDELKRLKIEASKAIERARTKKEDEEDFEAIDEPGVENLYYLFATTPEPTWLIRDIWTEGACGIIAGPPKSFKSYMALDLAFSVSTGKPFLGEFPVRKPGPVLYIQEEDSVPTIRKRMGEIANGRAPQYHPGGDMEVVVNAEGKKELKWGPAHVPEIDAKVRSGITLSKGEWREWLDEEMSKKEYKVLLLDPMMMLVGDVEENRYSAMTTEFFKPLKQLAEKYQCAVILVHHTKKDLTNSRRAGGGLLGSQAAHAWTEDMMVVNRTGDRSSKTTVTRESKFAENLFFKMQPSIKGGVWIPNLAGDERSEVSGEPRTKGAEGDLGEPKNPAHKAMMELGAGAHTTRVIAEAMGKSRGAAYKQLVRLEEWQVATRDDNGDWTLR